MDDKDFTGKWSDDDKVVFVPDDLYYAYHRMLDNAERVVDALNAVKNKTIPNP
jgi:hypothetical protein